MTQRLRGSVHLLLLLLLLAGSQVAHADVASYHSPGGLFSAQADLDLEATALSLTLSNTSTAHALAIQVPEPSSMMSLIVMLTVVSAALLLKYKRVVFSGRF
jgi:hypothetical protein